MAVINELLLSLPVGLFQADRDGRITAANAAFGALVIGSTTSPVGLPPWSNAHPGDRASAELAWRRAVDEDGPVQLDFRVWHGDGQMTWVRIDAEPEDMLETLTKYDLIAIPVLDSEGKMAGIVTVDDVLAHYLPQIIKIKRR